MMDDNDLGWLLVVLCLVGLVVSAVVFVVFAVVLVIQGP